MTDRPSSTSLGRSPLCAAALALAAFLPWSSGHAAQATGRDEPLRLVVNDEGLAVATAAITLPGSPEHARRLLSDVSSWPALFASSVTMESVIRTEGRTLADMNLSLPLFLGVLHMVVETEAVSPFRLETTLVRGDARRYMHRWELTPLDRGRCTRAGFELAMQLKSWVPDWLFRWALRRELERHLSLVVAEASRRAEDAGLCAAGASLERSPR